MELRGFVFLGTLLLVGTGFGQVETPAPPPAPIKPPSQISGGVLNGKAIRLPKPAYPAAARAVNAEGAVSVQVLIDENGSVVSADAVSGHPLLRAAAVEAARSATFSPTLLAGNPVKVSGIITYNFVGVTTTASIAYELAFAERTGAFGQYMHPKALAARLPEDWTTERTALEGLTFEPPPLDPEPPAPLAPASKAEKTRPAPERNYAVSKFTVKGSTVFAAESYNVGKLTAASREEIRALQTNIRSKLAGDDRNEWHFRVGTALGIFAAEATDANRTSQNLAEIEHLIGTAPSGINQTLINGLTKFVELSRSSDGSEEARQKLILSAQGLKNIRIQ